MGEKVQIARQDTLLEVQTTGKQTQNTLDLVNGKIGNFGDTAEKGTLFGQMAGGSGSSGAVKSVQRGYHSTPNSADYPKGKDVTIEINVVNPDKCFVILYPHVYYASGIDVGIKLKEVRSNQLVINIINNVIATLYFSWQIIEFF